MYNYCMYKLKDLAFLPLEFLQPQSTQSGNGDLVHSIMRVKSAQAGEGGRCKPTPFHYIYHHVQSCGVHSR